MRIFLSWSGQLSHKVALAFNDWFPSVFQSVETWLSSADIESGSRWADVLFRELQSDSFGIAFVTKSNPSAPWLNFEAGALAKQVTKARVVPFLFEMQGSDLPSSSPLKEFNYVIYGQGRDNRQTIFKLLSDVNKVNNPQLTEKQLVNTFEAFWPKLQRTLDQIIQDDLASRQNAAPPSELKISAVLEELLQLARNQERGLGDLNSAIVSNRILSHRGIDLLHSPAFQTLSQQLDTLEEMLEVQSRRKPAPPSSPLTVQAIRMIGSFRNFQDEVGIEYRSIQERLLAREPEQIAPSSVSRPAPPSLPRSTSQQPTRPRRPAADDYDDDLDDVPFD